MRGLAVRHPDVQVAFILLGGQPGHLDVIIAFILLGRQPRKWTVRGRNLIRLDHDMIEQGE